MCIFCMLKKKKRVKNQNPHNVTLQMPVTHRLPTLEWSLYGLDFVSGYALGKSGSAVWWYQESCSWQSYSVWHMDFTLYTLLHWFYVPGARMVLPWPIVDTWDIRKMLNNLTGGFTFSLSHPFVLPDSHKLISGCQPAQNISICRKAYYSKVIESGVFLFKVWGFFLH